MHQIKSTANKVTVGLLAHLETFSVQFKFTK